MVVAVEEAIFQIVAHAKCIPLLADAAVNRPRFPFNPAVISLFTAGIATPRTNNTR
jgi:hypothetical protein